MLKYPPLQNRKTIGTSILKIFEKIDGRIIFASFASNIFRLQQAADAAVKPVAKLLFLVVAWKMPLSMANA